MAKDEEKRQRTVKNKDCRLRRVRRQPAARVNPESLAAARPARVRYRAAPLRRVTSAKVVVPAEKVVVGSSRWRALFRGHGEGVACRSKREDSVRRSVKIRELDFTTLLCEIISNIKLTYCQ